MRGGSPVLVVVGCWLVAALTGSCSTAHGLRAPNPPAQLRSPRMDGRSTPSPHRPSVAAATKAAPLEPIKSHERDAPRPCRAGQLHVRLLDESAGAGSFGPLFSAGSSTDSCTLTGYPSLVLIGCRTTKEWCSHPHRLRAVQYKRGEAGFFRNPRQGRVIVGAKSTAQFALLLSLAGFDATPDLVTGVSVRLGSRLTRPLPVKMIFSGPRHERYTVGETAWGATLRRR